MTENIFELDVSGEETLAASTPRADQVRGSGVASAVINTVPGPDSPLIFKIVAQKRPSGTYEGYWRVTHHTHLVGDLDPTNKKNYRSHLCQKTLGRECPECDKYWNNYKEMKELEKVGKKGTPEYNRLESQNKVLRPSDKGWVFVVLPDQPTVKAIKLPRSVLDQLWGKAATKFRPAIESIINKMVADGADPYNLQSETGWIKVWKVGEGIGTQYHVEPATTVADVTMAGGKVGKATVPVELKVHDRIGSLTTKDLPNLGKMEEKNIWSEEDSKFFSENFRAPDHILEKSKGVPEEEDDDPLGNGAAGLPVVSAPPTQPTQVASQPNPTMEPSAVDNLL